jgi:CRISPR-associated protein Cmr4
MAKSKLYDTKLYFITALTNLHVGNGDTNYSVIDKQVQRDIVTNMPVIYSSSLKGAIREYITHIDKCEQAEKGNHSDEHTKSLCQVIFGSEPVEKEKSIQGKYVFYEAKLLSLPVRTNKHPFMRATSKRVLKEFVKSCENFSINCGLTLEDIEAMQIQEDGNIIVENQEWKYGKPSGIEKLNSLIGENCILLKDEHFEEIANELPFVARNYLENGKSENLWYEEIVPRESIFYFFIQQPTNIKKEHEEKVKEHFATFDAYLKDTQLFIGANTTIGYGLCNIKEQGGENEQTNS